MSKATVTVTVPQLGVNDEQAELVEWLIGDGNEVTAGEPLCVLETTKATYEVEAEISGYLVRLIEEHEEVGVQQEIAVIVSSREKIEAVRRDRRSKNEYSVEEISASVKATRKAIQAAEKHGIDLAGITPGSGEIVRESDVMSVLESRARIETPLLQIDVGPGHLPVAVYGSGNGAVTMHEALEMGDRYRVVCFIDDTPRHPTALCGLPVYHGSKLGFLSKEGIGHIALAIGNGRVRMKLKGRIESAGFELINVIHPQAHISPSAVVGLGNYIKAGAVIETKTRIGDCCIIDNGAVLAHDNLIHDGCHIAPGATFGSSITVGKNTVVGIGSCISTNIEIGSNCIISVGSAVTKNVADNSVVDGVPAKVIGKTK